MKAISLYFQVHQPFRLKRYRFFDIGNDHYYYDDYLNRTIMEKVAKQCYLPANEILYNLIQQHGDAFKVCFSISGSALEQFELYAPEVIESFNKLVKTGNVELLSETYSHSLSSLASTSEFKDQVKRHSAKIETLFGVKPKVFRNTELIYSDEIGATVAKMGYKAMLTEGAKHVLGWKSPNYIYHNAINPKLKLLLKNFSLSDDIAFRFSNHSWAEWPLTADKFVNWIQEMDEKEDLLNLFMDYETFGEHQSTETGIFDFLRAFPTIAIQQGLEFVTPSESIKKFDPIAAIQAPNPISWADEERDLTAWLGNELQDEAFMKLYNMRNKVITCKDKDLYHDWLMLQNSDHFYYMCTKWFSDGDVHKYFNPYASPYEAFLNYMNILSDFISRIEQNCPLDADADIDVDHLQTKIKSMQKILRKLKAEQKKSLK